MAHQSIEFTKPVFKVNKAVEHAPDRRVKLQYKSSWTDPWIDLDNARADFCSWSCSPSYPRAQFTVRYGYGMQPEDTEPQYYPFVDMSRKWIRISLPDTDDVNEEGWVWIGQVEIVGEKIEATFAMDDFEGTHGEYVCVCFGLERMFDQVRINSSLWYDTVAAAEKTANVGLEFNKGGKPNRTATYRSTNNHYLFASGAKDESEVAFWSTQDIVEYLVQSTKAMPLDQDGNNDLGFFITAGNIAKLPDWDAPNIETHLVSAHQVMSALINRRRLHTWWLEINEATDPNKVEVKVATFTDAALDLGNGNEIAANADTLDITLNDHPTVAMKQTDYSHAVDQVVCYGARIRHCCTTEFGTDFEEWNPGWSFSAPDELSAYENAGIGAPGYPADFDERIAWVRDARKREDVNHVFRKYVLNDQVDFPPNDPDSYKVFPDNVRVESRLPMLQNLEYQGNAIQSGNFVSHGIGYWPERDPLFIIEIPGEVGKYVRLEDIGNGIDLEPSEPEKNRNWSCNVTIPNDGQTLDIRVVGGPQHAIGGADFGPVANIDDDKWGDWDWRKIKATVSFEDERYAEAKWPLDAAVPTTVTKRVMRIPAGSNYQLVYVPSGTVVDLDDDRTEMVSTNDGYIRDDRPKLESLARMAHSWYGQERRVVRLNCVYDNPVKDVKIGHYLKWIKRTPGGPQETVGSLISQVSVRFQHAVGDEPRNDLPPAMVEVATAFGELDVVRLRL